MLLMKHTRIPLLVEHSKFDPGIRRQPEVGFLFLTRPMD